MAIREVDYIPTPYKKGKSFSQMAREDILEALDKNISKFEFEGEYNYKTLGTIARYEAEKIFREKFYYPAVDSVCKRLNNDGYEDVKIPDGWNSIRGRIKISGVTLGDRMHVFCEIDYTALSTFEVRLLEATRQVPCNKRRQI